MPTSGGDHEPEGGELSPEERAAFQKRAAELGARLERAKADVAARQGPVADGKARGAAFGQAMKIAVELVVGVAVGGFIGRVLDGALGTAPWLLIVFLVLGFAAGLANVVRTARRMQADAEAAQRAARPVADDEDET
jgi:ATP synthase protein I